MADPYCARTLRMVARSLRRERDALRLLADRSGGATPGDLRAQALQCDIESVGFSRQARDIERKKRNG